MGDRAAGQLVIHSTVPADVPAILEFIEEWGLSPEWGATASPENAVLISVVYGHEEVSIGMVYDSDLHEKAPNTAFAMWVDPKYEYMGDLAIHVPEMELYRSECDSSGDAILTDDYVLDLLRRYAIDSPLALQELHRTLFKRAGGPWYEAIAKLPKQPAEVRQPSNTEGAVL